MTDGTGTVPLASQRVDPRITRTRAALIRALSTLVSETPKGETISMSAVAQRAGLSRQALHNHYSNVGDLATDLWISRLLEHWLPLDDAAANLPQALTDAVRERGIEPLLAAGRADRGFFDKLRAVPRGERVAEVLAAAMTTWLSESDHDHRGSRLLLRGHDGEIKGSLLLERDDRVRVAGDREMDVVRRRVAERARVARQHRHRQEQDRDRTEDQIPVAVR